MSFSNKKVRILMVNYTKKVILNFMEDIHWSATTLASEHSFLVCDDQDQIVLDEQ